jgi:N-acetylglucosaminyl-diphospho-decaprenol L-rhamnosyltransferase
LRDSHRSSRSQNPLASATLAHREESCFRDRSPFSELIAAARTRYVTALLQRYVVPMPVAISELRPSWISFAAVLVRDEVLKSAGMLDENFFLYFEDCKYCYRARKEGWEIVHVPRAQIIHLHGPSSQVDTMITTARAATQLLLHLAHKIFPSAPWRDGP